MHSILLTNITTFCLNNNGNIFLIFTGLIAGMASAEIKLKIQNRQLNTYSYRFKKKMRIGIYFYVLFTMFLQHCDQYCIFELNFVVLAEQPHKLKIRVKRRIANRMVLSIQHSVSVHRQQSIPISIHRLP